MSLRRCAALAAALVMAAGAAPAADRAGAAALESDFNAFFAGLAETLALEIAPAAPVKVALADDVYRATIGPFTVSGADPDGESVDLVVQRFSIWLRPDDADSNLMHYSLEAMPDVALRVGGVPAVELSADLASSSGIWSDALDMPVAESTVIEGLRVEVTSDLLSDSYLLPLFAALVVGRLEVNLQAVEHGPDAWRVESDVAVDDLSVYASGALGTVRIPIDPETGLQAVQHYDRLESHTILSGAPLAAWHDFVLDWVQRLAALRGQEPADPQGLLTAFLEGLPALPDKMDVRTLAEGVASEGLFIERQQQILQVTGLASDVLDLRLRDRISGLRLVVDDNPLAERLAPMAPVAYTSDLELRDLPLGYAWRALIDTADAWVDAPGPDAAAEVFFRSFANRALAIGSAMRWDLGLEWPSSRFDLDLDLAVSETAEMTVAGVADGAFTGMAALGGPLGEAVGPEAASGWVLLQAFGQREEPADGGSVVTRYRVEIDEDGHATLNGQDYDIVIRMMRQAFEGGIEAFEMPTIPTPD